MKIVVVNTHFVDEIGGSQLQCDLIADELYKRGYDVTYLAIDKKTDYERNYKIVGVSRDSSSIGRQLLKIDPDIVYWRFNKKYFYKSLKIIKEKKAKIIFAVSNVRDIKTYNTQFRGKFTFTNLLQFLLQNVVSRYNHLGFRYVDALTVNNEEQLNSVDLGIQIKRYIPNAINTKKREFNWRKPFILWVANLKKRKRPELFVKLSQKFEDSEVDFLMIGKLSGDSYKWITQELKTPSNLHYLGAKDVELVNGALAQSLFLVTTSTSEEGFSNNIIQAWLQKKPVVAYEFDPAGMIEEHGLGFVADRKFKNLTEKTRNLIENVTLREELGEKAFKFAKQHFSTKKTVDKLETLFHELVRKDK